VSNKRKELAERIKKGQSVTATSEVSNRRKELAERIKKGQSIFDTMED
jgi:hypothetical protein